MSLAGYYEQTVIADFIFEIGEHFTGGRAGLHCLPLTARVNAPCDKDFLKYTQFIDVIGIT